jgi:hypothetical protein
VDIACSGRDIVVKRISVLFAIVLVAACSHAVAPKRGGSIPSVVAPVPKGQIAWQGYRWTSRTGKGSPLTSGTWGGSDNVSVDSQDQLHLWIRGTTSAQISSVKNDWGYGTYRFRVESDSSGLTKSAVIGMFLYRDTPRAEIDLEASAWGQRPIVQWDHTLFGPYDSTINSNSAAVYTDSTPVSAGATEHEIIWTPTSVTWRTYNDAGVLLKESVATVEVPVPSEGMIMNFNFWQFGVRGVEPVSEEIVISRFEYIPAP